MGYTHYWERPAVLPRPQFLQAVADCRRLCDALAIPLGDAGGEGTPTLSDSEICFNGRVDSGRLMSGQQMDGLLWPRPEARGVATVGSVDPVAGLWGAGPAVNARVLGPGGDGSYETFRVERIKRPRHPRDRPADGWMHSFCKTNFRPYDLCVQGCLIILSHRLGNDLFRVSSDGESRQWNEAREVCQHVLGYGMDWGEGPLAPASPSVPPASAT